MAICIAGRSLRAIAIAAVLGSVVTSVAAGGKVPAVAPVVTSTQTGGKPQLTEGPQPSSQELLSQALDALGAKRTDSGRVLSLPGAHFAEGQTAFGSADQSRIDAIVTVLHRFPGALVVIEGFTDSRGSAQKNMRVSRERARSARRALIARGVEGARILTKGMADARPVASNSTAAGRERNRRVELVFSDVDGRFGTRGKISRSRDGHGSTRSFGPAGDG